MITQSDRDVPIMAHVRAKTKERLRSESERRNMSMSALISELLEAGLDVVEKHEVKVRSNKRRTPTGDTITTYPDGREEIDRSLPLEKE